MRRILIPVDGSKPSVNALDYVVKRKKTGEALKAFVLNVQRAISPGAAGLVTRSMIREYQTLESEKVLQSAEIRTRSNYLGAETHVEIGDAATCIIAFARDAKCHEIVMGSRGVGGIRGVLLGSVVHKVLQVSPIPVVVIK